MSLVRNPALWTGLALIAIGGGNWINGQAKMAEYEALSSHPPEITTVSAPEEFPNLNERTTTTLLEPIRSRSSAGSYFEGKRDFYRVVLSGGRVLVLFGAFFVVTATYWENRRRATAPA
jgi:hypothetical protein